MNFSGQRDRWIKPDANVIDVVGDCHVGGCDDLHALEQRGALDPLLAGA